MSLCHTNNHSCCDVVKTITKGGKIDSLVIKWKCNKEENHSVNISYQSLTGS